ncbi:MAG: ABC transporter permease [Lachnospiraceae bacterium]|nr:ABC transporter permease [Lachnospiraceae bacterium]
MNTLSMAYKNLRKNLSFYALYLFSVSLVITVFFAFTSFSMNQVMLEVISTNGRVESMCSIISVFLMIFVVFYMGYSNRFFLKRRTKELGIYTLLGYRKTTILSLLTFENIFICFGAFLVGLVLGAIAHKGIVIGITALLKLSVDSAKIQFFHISAIRKTAGFILLVVFVLCMSNGRFLFKTSLMELIRFEKKAEKNMKFHRLPAFLGFIMILSGYGLALDIFRGGKSIWFLVGFYPIGMLTAMLIVIGTVFFISSFLPYVMKKSKSHKAAFYTKTKIITTPNFIYRIRSNARTLIMLTLLSAATLSISAIMALTVYYPIAAVSRIAPSEMEFRIEKEAQIEAAKKIIGRYAAEDVTFTRTDIYKVTSSASSLPMEYSVGTAKGDSDNEKILREAGFECISRTSYMTLLREQGKEEVSDSIPKLGSGECILVKYKPNSDNSLEVDSIYPLAIGDKEVPFTVKAVTLDNPFAFANSIGTLIVSDDIYKQLEATGTPVTSLMSINGKAIEDNEELYEEMRDMLAESPYLQGQSHRINELFSLNSSTFLLIGFLVVLFFIATGSILYFNNMSAVSDTKSDYQILIKMGYTNGCIKKIIRRQVLDFFAIPFAMGTLDCIFATVVFKAGLMQNLLGSTLVQYVPVVLAIALTAFIYLIYYFLTIRTCCKIVCKK